MEKGQEVHKDERQKFPSARTTNPIRLKILANDCTIAASQLIKIKKKDKSLNSREIEAHIIKIY